MTATRDDLISAWRADMLAMPALTADDVAELEDHLISQADELRRAGLTDSEALLISLRRLGARDAVAHAYAQTHPGRQWLQLAFGAPAGESPSPSGSASGAPGSGASPLGAPVPSTPPRSPWRFRVPRLAATPPGIRDLGLALLLGVLAGLALRLPSELISPADGVDIFYSRNIAALGLPFLAIYLAVRSHALRSARGGLLLLAVVAAGSTAVVNLFPRAGEAAMGDSLTLSAVSLPVALLLVTGIAYLGSRWRDLEAWMDWLRFLGESIIYSAILWMATVVVGGVIMLLFITVMPEDLVLTLAEWALPIAVGLVVMLTAWLVERKKSVMANMAPVLTTILTPALVLALAVFLVAAAVVGGPSHLDREVLIVYDLVLILVMAIVVFTVSARDPLTPARPLDWLQLVLIVGAVAADLIVLWSLVERFAAYGSSPNKTTALGLNLILLALLSGSAWHYWGVLRRGRTSLALERWQCVAVPVLVAWALIVALILPPIFGYR